MEMFFANTERGVFLTLTPPFEVTKQKLYDWLRDYHSEIFWDIELHEKGPEGVTISIGDIMFSGDNGLFILDRIFPDKL